VKYWLGLGSNIGDRLVTLRRAADALGRFGTVLARSRVFASSPVGGPPQPPFLNAAVLLESGLEPQALLAAVEDLESQFGRDRSHEAVRWGPRTLDIDILMMGERGELHHNSETLDIPHARLHERAFALAPLADLDAQLIHPTLARPIKGLLASCAGKGDACASTGDQL
jgi:2-amino-4-hydroxy-6-hydroxymethyldihydropteridine diphosphokinase